MTFLWIGVALLVAALTVVLLRKSSVRAEPTPRPVARPNERRETPAAPALATPTVVAPAPAPTPPADAGAGELQLPQALADFRLLRADDVPEARRDAYASAFKDIPRPPKLLDHLLSPDFVNAASSTQLVDMIAGEPLMAAKILTAVNSPMYGLKSPVGSIGQAVTYLGLNTVRGLCLQYILIESFKADSAARKQMLDATWTASAVASELAQQLSQRLGFEDRGSLVSAVVLSFIGRLATTSSVSLAKLATIVPHGLLARAVSEQKTLGLSASQIGRLLMTAWGLPAPIIDDATSIDLVLVTPSSSFDAEHGSRLALCYTCARLGERLAEGSLADPGWARLRGRERRRAVPPAQLSGPPPAGAPVGDAANAGIGASAQQVLAAMRGR